MTTAIVQGSLSAVAKQTGKSLAETFLSASVVVIVDTSGSMGNEYNESTRYERACQELAKIQAQNPGKVAVISFSDSAMFCPGGVPVNLRGSTNLAGALDYARIADVPKMRFIVISDGEPDSRQAALIAAQKYNNRIDTIFIGDDPLGKKFMEELAALKAGQALNQEVGKLADGITYLLGSRSN